MPLALSLALCGAAGALTYSFPVYLKAVSEVPPAQFSVHRMIFSVFVGGLFAAILTNVIGRRWAWTIDPEPYPLALVIGLACNPLIPIVLRRLEAWAEKVTPGDR